VRPAHPTKTAHNARLYTRFREKRACRAQKTVFNAQAKMNAGNAKVTIFWLEVLASLVNLTVSLAKVDKPVKAASSDIISSTNNAKNAHKIVSIVGLAMHAAGVFPITHYIKIVASPVRKDVNNARMVSALFARLDMPYKEEAVKLAATAFRAQSLTSALPVDLDTSSPTRNATPARYAGMLDSALMKVCVRYSHPMLIAL
jgi:hypothetical protein